MVISMYMYSTTFQYATLTTEELDTSMYYVYLVSQYKEYII